MFEHFEAERAKKKAMSTEEKKAAKKSKDEMEAKYTTCLLDGRKEKVGNFRVEPPGLFRGRGEHPKKGALKVRTCCALTNLVSDFASSFVYVQRILL
jgi:DNA topoisomerase-1